MPGLFFLFFLLGQDGLHHVARLGDVRKINLGNNGLSGVAGGGSARRGRKLDFLHKMRTNPLRLVRLNRAGVRLDARHAELRENVDNRPRLNFQLARQIVDTNLTHPPLFKKCAAKPPLVAHSYLMALAALCNP
jgi:hypothetical protein